MSVSLGFLSAEESEVRDAVHIPIVSVEAGESLQPGQAIYFKERKAYAAPANGRMVSAAVDPYLREPVNQGERFFAVLHPYSVYGLHHEWEHGEFPRPIYHRASESERWLRTFAEQWRIPYEEMIQGAVTGDGVTFGVDFHPPADELDPEFWSHLSKLTGREFDKDHRRLTNSESGCSC